MQLLHNSKYLWLKLMTFDGVLKWFIARVIRMPKIDEDVYLSERKKLVSGRFFRHITAFIEANNADNIWL